MTKSWRKSCRSIHWKQTLSAAVPPDCVDHRTRMRRYSGIRVRQAVLLRNEPPFERASKRTLKWLSVFGLCTRREAFAFATSPAAQPATEEVHRWKATVRCWFFLLLSPCSDAAFLAARVPPCLMRPPCAAHRNSTLPADS